MQDLQAAVDAFDLLKDLAALVSVAGRIQEQVAAFLEPDDLVLRNREIFARRFVDRGEHIVGNVFDSAEPTAAKFT